MRVLFTICGRKGSKGIKNKNISNFVGKPLVYYTISAIDLFLKNTDLDIEEDIVLNTDSEELIELVNNNNMRKIDIIKRKDSLAGDTVGKVDVIRDCYNQMKERKKIDYDIIVDLDITSPLRISKDINNLLKKHIETKADVTTSVTQARRNPYFNQVKKTDKGYEKVIESTYTARQQAPMIYDMNASLYAYSVDFLQTDKDVLDGYTECIQMYDTAVLDLDHENDFELMQVIAKYLFDSNNEFSLVRNNIK